MGMPSDGSLAFDIAAKKVDLLTTWRLCAIAWEAIQARLDRDGFPEHQASDLPALHGDADPVLAHLWNNPDDER
jgi:hypothetical protein